MAARGESRSQSIRQVLWRIDTIDHLYYAGDVAMGTREAGQPPLWIATSDLPTSPGHPFYTRLNAILYEAGLDVCVEDQCER